MAQGMKSFIERDEGVCTGAECDRLESRREGEDTGEGFREQMGRYNAAVGERKGGEWRGGF
jgi:hypothetical protein